MSIEKTLSERGNRYGDFADHARLAQRLQDCMREFARPLEPAAETFGMITPWDHLSPVQKQALTVIADKIARILSGDPNYADNWHDIQGYAKLVEDRLPARSSQEHCAFSGNISTDTPMRIHPHDMLEVSASFSRS